MRRRDIERFIGTSGTEADESDEALVGKADIVLLLADALRSEQGAEEAAAFVERRVEISAEREPEGAADVSIRPLAETDPYLSRLCAALSEPSGGEKRANEHQTRYANLCKRMAVRTKENVVHRPVMSRSVLAALGHVHDATERVDCRGFRLGPNGVPPLCLTLRGLPRLKQLSLSRNDVRDDSLPSIVDLVQSLPLLAELDLSNN
eukprot:gene11060-16997_t